jgi:hypothetical protein
MGFPNYDVAKMLLKGSQSGLVEPLPGADSVFHNNKMGSLLIKSYCGSSA